MVTILVIISMTLTLTSARPQVEIGRSMFVEYHPGDASLILVVPHGGSGRFSAIPDRHAGCWDGQECSFQDSCGNYDLKNCPADLDSEILTNELAALVAEEFYKLSGKWPHLIQNRLVRRKLDASFPLAKATCHHSDVVKAWHDFHRFVNKAINTVNGRGLFLDLTGHSREMQTIKLGYGVASDNLTAGEVNLNDSTIHHLVGEVGTNVDELVRGRTSLGGYLQAAGYDTAPSPKHPQPQNHNNSSGSYNTLTYGRKMGTYLDAIQIETPRSLRTNQNLPIFAKTFSRAIWLFMERYYAKKPSVVCKRGNEEKGGDLKGKRCKTPRHGSFGQKHLCVVFMLILYSIIYSYSTHSYLTQFISYKGPDVYRTAPPPPTPKLQKRDNFYTKNCSLNRGSA